MANDQLDRSDVEGAERDQSDRRRETNANFRAAVPISVVPSAERLDQPHSVVTVTNTHRAQRHIVLDRHFVGHELEPGQTVRNIEMLNSEIDSFRRARDPRRRNSRGESLPLHPLVFADVTPVDSRAQPDEQDPVMQDENRRRAESSREENERQAQRSQRETMQRAENEAQQNPAQGQGQPRVSEQQKVAQNPAPQSSAAPASGGNRTVESSRPVNSPPAKGR